LRFYLSGTMLFAGEGLNPIEQQARVVLVLFVLMLIVLFSYAGWAFIAGRRRRRRLRTDVIAARSDEGR